MKEKSVQSCVVWGNVAEAMNRTGSGKEKLAEIGNHISFAD